MTAEQQQAKPSDKTADLIVDNAKKRLSKEVKDGFWLGLADDISGGELSKIVEGTTEEAASAAKKTGLFRDVADWFDKAFADVKNWLIELKESWFGKSKPPSATPETGQESSSAEAEKSKKEAAQKAAACEKNPNIQECTNVSDASPPPPSGETPEKTIKSK